MKPLVLVLYPGVRARAYLQMMVRAGLAPDHAVLLGTETDDTYRAQWDVPPEPDFDPREDLRSTLMRAQIPTHRIASLDVNGASLRELLVTLAPRCAVFSGGGILRGEALDAVPRWLHVHPGWLPDLRGSTCIHFGLLLHGRVGITAFFMERGIDLGPIVCQRDFAPDPRWSALSLDHAADAWMRGVVLLDALRALDAASPLLPRVQDPAEGTTFRIIHPVLKHLALLGVPLADATAVPLEDALASAH